MSCNVAFDWYKKIVLVNEEEKKRVKLDIIFLTGYLRLQ
jgi:hypothetical protein